MLALHTWCTPEDILAMTLATLTSRESAIERFAFFDGSHFSFFLHQNPHRFFAKKVMATPPNVRFRLFWALWAINLFCFEAWSMSVMRSCDAFIHLLPPPPPPRLFVATFKCLSHTLGGFLNSEGRSCWWLKACAVASPSGRRWRRAPVVTNKVHFCHSLQGYPCFLATPAVEKGGRRKFKKKNISNWSFNRKTEGRQS